MNILVIGANGQIGQKIVHKIHNNTPHDAIAMVRKESQREQFEKKGIKTVLADLEGDFSHAYEGNNAVIFTAGSGGHTGADKTEAVDKLAAIKAIDLALKHRYIRFIEISAFGADFDPKQWPEKMSHYYSAKSAADDYLQQTRLNYTIIKPGMLTNDEPTGKVDYGERTEERKGSVPRADVAEVVVKSLEARNTYRKSLELLSGPNTIEKAIEKIGEPVPETSFIN
ncbi:SDR family oxidoreductase [Marivirga sp. S37H4]|uniref:SDR family oxidoreductase n=1 Tax=Marivirga aurantiaca TaxID=2802615 RepID=A0A934X1E0_9BACT|nr:SDR family oxidoreductase [Marivirga aurantiaca]MBK6267134.1 SDR family oxidoreductase [Marivirga aurantiaca]